MSETKDNNHPPAGREGETAAPEPAAPEQDSSAPEQDSSAADKGTPELPKTAATSAGSDTTDFERDVRPPSSGRGFPLLATLALLLVLVLAAGAAWVVMEAQRREAALEDRMALLESVTEELESSTEGKVLSADQQENRLREYSQSLENDLQQRVGEGLSRLAPQMKSQSQQLEAQDERLRELARQLESMDTRVSEQGEELARFNASDRATWLLAEVEYLLRLANQRLIMTGDVDSAQALLHSADTILAQLDDVRLHPVRRAVAADLAALRAVPRVDTEGLYVRVSALAEEADSLSIFELPEAEQRLEPAPAENWRERLRQGWEAALHKLSEYIVIRRRDVPMQALMDPQWEGLVRQNLRMLLEQAQVALLSGNGRLYRESLERASHWVAQFLDTDGHRARAMDAELERLSGETIASELPDISRSLQALERQQAERDRTAEQ